MALTVEPRDDSAERVRAERAKVEAEIGRAADVITAVSVSEALVPATVEQTIERIFREPDPEVATLRNTSLSSGYILWEDPAKGSMH